MVGVASGWFSLELLLLLLLVLAALFLAKMASQGSNSIRSSMVVVVLGEKFLPSGDPSLNLQTRIAVVAKEAVAIYKAEHVILSGGDTAQVNKPEATVMKKLWQKDTVSSSAVELHLGKVSLSTCENAFYSIPILQKLGAAQCALLS